MTRIGIVGGIGPESTVEYYKLMVSAYLDRNRDGNYPQILINSINMKRMLDLIGAGQLDEVATFLSAEIGRLARAGADMALLASNTPHIVFDRLRQMSALPLISIVEAACDAAESRNLRCVGLFGTRFTMQGGFYQKVFSGRNIAVVTPAADEQDFIHRKYMEELVLGVLKPETRAALIEIARNLKAREHIEALVLGGTELPLILKDTDDVGVPLLDTTRIHVASVMAQLR